MIQRYSDGLSSRLLANSRQASTTRLPRSACQRAGRVTNDYSGREVAEIGEAFKTNYLLTHADALQVKAYSNGAS